MIIIARRPTRPRVPTDQRFATGHLASLPDQTRSFAALRPEAFSRSRAYPDAARNRALGPVGPAGPLPFHRNIPDCARSARMHIALSGLHGQTIARRRFALPDPVLRTSAAEAVASLPSGPFAPSGLHREIRVRFLIRVSPHAGAIVPAIPFLLFGQLNPHAGRVIRLRAATESKPFLDVTHARTLKAAVGRQPRCPAGISFRLDARMSVAFLGLR